jgi:hypothetical protein
VAGQFVHQIEAGLAFTRPVVLVDPPQQFGGID